MPATLNAERGGVNLSPFLRDLRGNSGVALEFSVFCVSLHQSCTLSHARNTNRTVMADSGSAYGCVLCSVQSPSLSLWMSHVHLVHPLDENISIPCPVSGCNTVYAKTNSHIYRIHRDIIVCSSNNPSASSENSVNEVAITPCFPHGFVAPWYHQP